MKILVLSTIDSKGGAAYVAWELRKHLKSLGHKVDTFVRYKYSNEDDVHIIPRKRYQDWLVKLFANDLTFARSKYILNTKEYKDADIVHCHNLHSNFFDLKLLKRISAEKPVIWTMHDIWAITGYASDSITRKKPNKKRFLLYLWDNTPLLLKMKERIYRKCKITVVAVSEFMKREIENSILKNQNCLMIYNGIDTKLMQPKPRSESRKILGLPIDKNIILCNVKGITFSKEIAKSFKNDPSVYWIFIGNSISKEDNPNFKSVPYIDGKENLREYLNASDIFLNPAPSEAFGLINAESLSCGTPIVGISVDAVPELVSHKKTGYLAKEDNIEELKEGIKYLLSLSPEEKEKMRLECRNKAVSNFSLEEMNENYMKLYKEVLSKSK